MFGRTKNTTSNQTPVNPVRVVKDAGGAAAVDLDAVKAAGHVSLAKDAATVGVSLRKRNLAGMRGRVAVVLDHSGSMHNDYASGVVQELLVRTLAFGFQIDPQAMVEVIPFDYGVWPGSIMRMDNYQTAARSIWKPNEMGSTNLSAALDRVRDMAADTEVPIVCVVITDGNPNDRTGTTNIVCDLARYPVFLKFLAIRDVPYLQELDDLEQVRPGARLLDNVDSKTIPDPARISVEAFAEAMVDEWDSWLKAAQAAGVLVA